MDTRDVRIATPCRLDWTKMTPADGGRFCGDCKKVVRDLSKMSSVEARALLRTPPTEGLCVRYIHDRDGKIFFAGDAPLLPASLLARGKRAAKMAAALAVPLAVQACAVPASLGLSSSDDSTSTHADPDAGWTENMGGVAYEPDAGDPFAPDAAPDASHDAASDGATAADAASRSDASPDGSHEDDSRDAGPDGAF